MGDGISVPGKIAEVRSEVPNRNHAGKVGAAATRKLKMVDLDPEVSNQIIDVMADWNALLEAQGLSENDFTDPPDPSP